MLVLVTYDVSTETESGRKRLRKVAKCCVKYGQRVQNSVFECVLDEAQYKQMQHQLISMIDMEKDLPGDRVFNIDELLDVIEDYAFNDFAIKKCY